MLIGNRLRCYPTDSQQQALKQWIGCQRFIYNAKVSEDRYFRAFAYKVLSNAGIHPPVDQQYSQFKTEDTPWLKDVPSQVLRNGATKWRQAYARFFQKLGGRPKLHKNHGKQSVWITNELFEFVPIRDKEQVITGYQLTLGTRKFPLGELKYNAPRAFVPPSSIHISLHNGRWHLSFNYEDGVIEPKDSETQAHLETYTEAQLRAVTLGLDRGVALPLATSDGQVFTFSPVQQKRLKAEERRKKRWQRRLARRQLGSAGRAEAKAKVARYGRYANDVRRDVAHKTSHALANNPKYELFVFEDLKVKNMTKKPKAKKDANGKWVRNGARAKAGLNKAILASTWGMTHVFLKYKARRNASLCITVPAFFSSQECAVCGHTHPDNRVSQSEFVCKACGHRDNADHNASVVIAKRGVAAILAGIPEPKKKKDCRITRQKKDETREIDRVRTAQIGQGETPDLCSATMPH